VPALAREGIAKGQGEPPDVQPALAPAATPDELEADPLLLVRQQCETMLQQGSRRWDLTTVPREKCDELGRTLRAALLSFEHAIYLRGMVEHAFDDDGGFHDQPPPRSVLLVLKRACAEFVDVRGEEDAFRVVAEYNRLGDAYAPDPDGPAAAAVVPPSMDAALEPASGDAESSPAVELPPVPEPETETPALATGPGTHSLSEWLASIGLGHVEGVLQEKIYSNPDTASFSGAGGLATVQNLDGDDMDDVVDLLSLSRADETVFRKEMLKISGNQAHCPPSSSSSKSGNRISRVSSALKSPRKSEGDKAWEQGKAAYTSRNFDDAVKHLTVALEKGTADHRFVSTQAILQLLVIDSPSLEQNAFVFTGSAD
jgi:hypothetical protein